MRTQPSLVRRARDVAQELLGGYPELLDHSAQAAEHAARACSQLPQSRGPEVVAAAWLHDIGYRDTLVRTAFHPLDGALYLMDGTWPDRVVRLVAHHSLACLEAPFYGVAHHLSVIEPVVGVDADVLISADLAGATDRLTEIRERDEVLGLVPADVRESRYAGMLAADERVRTALSH